MTVAATSREAKISEAIVNMLAACAQVQIDTGTVTSTAAKAFIVEGFGGTRGIYKAVDGTSTVDLTGIFYTVNLGIVTSEPRARDTYGWSAVAEIVLHLPIIASDDPASVIRRARNSQGLIRDQLEAQLGSTSPFQALAKAAINPEQIELADDITANRLHLLVPISLAIGDLP